MHTLYHVFLCIVPLPVLGMLILCGILSHKIVGKVCICCLSLCSKFFACYFVRNAWFCAATISLSFSAFMSPFDSQKNVSSSLISCLSIFLMYCHALFFLFFFHFFFRDSPNLAFMCRIPSCFVSLFHLVDLILL